MSSCCRELVEKLIADHFLKIFLACYEAEIIITIFTRGHHWPLFSGA
jgi:hypothetical protein